MEVSDIILKMARKISPTAIQIRAIGQSKTIKTPMEVAVPFPPLKPRQIGQL